MGVGVNKGNERETERARERETENKVLRYTALLTQLFSTLKS